MTLPAQTFRLQVRGAYRGGQTTASTGETVTLSFNQTRGSSFGDGVREFAVQKDFEEMGTIRAEEMQGGSDVAGSANANVTFHEPGTWTITDRETHMSVRVEVSGSPTGSGFSANQDFDYTYAPEKAPDYDYGEDQIDPSNYAGVVHADNEQGIALAPSLRREGASLGPNGATVNLPDGRSVEVGAIQEADEVARVIEGDNAGDVIDADQPATDEGSSGTSGQSDGFGGAAAALAVLAVGYALTR